MKKSKRYQCDLLVLRFCYVLTVKLRESDSRKKLCNSHPGNVVYAMASDMRAPVQLTNQLHYKAMTHKLFTRQYLDVFKAVS